MTTVYEKLKVADVLVIASPVYFYGVSAQLKALIDLYLMMEYLWRIGLWLTIIRL